jgi:hypothetical protein
MHRDARHIADEGFGESTDVGMVRHQRRQWTAVSLDGELTVTTLFYLRKPTQLIESRRRRFEPGAEVTHGGGTLISEPAATDTQECLNQIGRYLFMQSCKQLVQDDVIRLGK